MKSNLSHFAPPISPPLQNSGQSAPIDSNTKNNNNAEDRKQSTALNKNAGKANQIRLQKILEDAASATVKKEEENKLHEKLNLQISIIANLLHKAFETETHNAKRILDKSGIDRLPGKFLQQHKAQEITNQSYMNSVLKVENRYKRELTQEAKEIILASKTGTKLFGETLLAVQNFNLSCAYFQNGQYVQAMEHVTKAINSCVGRVDYGKGDKKFSRYPDSMQLNILSVDAPAKGGVLKAAHSKNLNDLLEKSRDLALASLDSAQLGKEDMEVARATATAIAKATTMLLDVDLRKSDTFGSKEDAHIDDAVDFFKSVRNVPMTRENKNIQEAALADINTILKRLHDTNAKAKVKISEVENIVDKVEKKGQDFGKNYLQLKRLGLTREFIERLYVYKKTFLSGVFADMSKDPELWKRYMATTQKLSSLLYILCSQSEFLEISEDDIKELSNWNDNIQRAIFQEFLARFSSFGKTCTDLAIEIEEKGTPSSSSLVSALREASGKYTEITDGISALIQLDVQLHGTTVTAKDRKAAQAIIRNMILMDEEFERGAAAAEAGLTALLEELGRDDSKDSVQENKAKETPDEDAEEIALPSPAQIEIEETAEDEKSRLRKNLTDEERLFEESLPEVQGKIENFLEKGRNPSYSPIDREDEMEWAATLVGSQIESKIKIISLRGELARMVAKKTAKSYRLKNEEDRAFIAEAKKRRAAYSEEGKSIRLIGTFNMLVEEFKKQQTKKENFTFPFEHFAYIAERDQEQSSNKKFITCIKSPERKLSDLTSYRTFRPEEEQDIIVETIIRIAIPGERDNVNLAQHDHLDCVTREWKHSLAKLERDRLLGSDNERIISRWDIKERDRSKLRALLDERI